MWLEKRGWNPNWYHPENDELDIMMKDNQKYLKRLIMGAGNLSEQVEDRKRAFEASLRLEQDTDDEPIDAFLDRDPAADLDFEGETDLAKELIDLVGDDNE